MSREELRSLGWAALAGVMTVVCGNVLYRVCFGHWYGCECSGVAAPLL